MGRIFLSQLLIILLSSFRRAKRKIKCFPYRSILKRNLQIKHIFTRNSRCFVVGAGPSLRKLDTNLLENEVIIGMNAGYLDQGIQRVRHKYWVVIDYFFMEPIPVDAIRAIEDGVGEATYFFPVQAKPICEEHELFKDKEIYYFYLCDLATENDPITDDRMDLLSAIIQPRGSAETAIICAVFMGFKQIYLIGADSDWFAHQSPEENHFYREADNPHSIDDKIKSWIDHSQMESKLYYGYVLYRSYRLLWEALKKRGVRVYNASGGGLLDVFPLADYNKLFKT